MKIVREEKFPHDFDSAIHCDHLPGELKLKEYRASFRLLLDIQALLKLVTGGNHDSTMDILAFREKARSCLATT